MEDKIRNYEKFLMILVFIYIVLYCLKKVNVVQYLNLIEILSGILIILLSFTFSLMEIFRKSFKRASIMFFLLLPMLAIFIWDPPMFLQSLSFDSNSKNDAIKKGVFLWEYKPSKTIIRYKDVDVVIEEVYVEKRSQWKNFNMNKLVVMEGEPRIRIRYKYYNSIDHKKLTHKPKGFDITAMIFGVWNEKLVIKDIISPLTSEDTICFVFAEKAITKANKTYEIVNPIDTIYMYPQ